MKKLLTNSKCNFARNLGLALVLIVPIIYATSCKKDDPDPITPPVTNTCETEQNNLNTAIASENGFNNTFNVNADSCIYYWAPQMPASFVSNAYNNLQNVGTAPYTKRDSTQVLTLKTNSLLPSIPETDPKYFVLKGISRTGGNALTAWDAYLNAQIATQNAQTALTECQNSN